MAKLGAARMSTPTQDCTISLKDQIRMRWWAFERCPKAIAASVGTSPAYVAWVLNQEAMR